jgi:Tfp pilus assembly protein PilN
MGDINLLPRGKRHSKQQKILVIIFILLLLITLFLLMQISQYLSFLIKQNSHSNQQTLKEITKLDIRIAEIERVKARIQHLQRNVAMLEKQGMTRLLLQHLFPELKKVLPKGVYLDKLMRQRRQIELVGYAKSEKEIAGMMAAISNSLWMQKPHLIKLTKLSNGDDVLPYLFSLQFTLKNGFPILRPFLLDNFLNSPSLRAQHRHPVASISLSLIPSSKAVGLLQGDTSRKDLSQSEIEGKL